MYEREREREREKYCENRVEVKGELHDVTDSEILSSEMVEDVISQGVWRDIDNKACR